MTDAVTTSPSEYGTDIGSETRTVAALNLVRSAVMPIAVRVILSRLVPSQLHRYYSAGADTRVIDVLPVPDEWVYVPELISADQAEALRKLLTIPYNDALEFDYMLKDD